MPCFSAEKVEYDFPMIVIVEDLDDPLCCFDWFWENHTYFEASIGHETVRTQTEALLS